jgi:protein O-mannosyl-transferase
MKAKPAVSVKNAVGKRATVAPDATESTARISPEARVTIVAAGLLVIFVFACYANSLWNGFVFDDHGHVLKNKLLRSIHNLPLLLSDYRPLRDISYAFDFSIWGERPFGFHLTNILIHATNSVLVFLIIKRFIGELVPAVIAAALFAVDPLQVDSVTYVSGRRDVLFALFYLGSFLSYLGYRRVRATANGTRQQRLKTALYLISFVLLWGLSLMSKEMAVSLPLFIFCWSFCEAWDKEIDSPIRRVTHALRSALKKDWWLYAALLAAALAFIWYTVAKGASTRARLSGLNFWGGSFYTNLLTSIRVHGWYLKQLVFPTPIVQYSGAFDVSTTLMDWRVIVSAIVVIGAVVAGFVMLNRNKLAAFAILSFFVLISPVSQIIPHHELLADHYLYLPLMSFALLVALAAQKLKATKAGPRIVYATLCLLVLACAVRTAVRNTVYKDDLSIWQANYQEAPNSTRAVSSLAGQYATSYPAKAAELYKRCIELEPSYSPAYVSLAFLYQTKDRAREAAELAVKGLELPDSRITSPGFDDPRRFRSEVTTALALSRGFEGNREEAERLLKEAINLYPVNPQPYALLAGYYRTVDPAREVEVRRQQLLVMPYDYDALYAVSYRLVDDKKYDEAIPYLDRMRGMLPNDFYANYQLGQIQRAKKSCAEARPYLTTARASASNPDEIKTAEDALRGLKQECP